MARIRIVDEWLRSPVSSPSRIRAIMVIADSWSEQRVLMRAYAAAGDQTRPTIVLHGAELAIGPAGPDPHGPWGIHVAPPADGRAQELRAHLELAARRLAGSKGNPPRLVDEASRFDEGPTGQWAPGAPPSPASPRGVAPGYYEPALAAPPAYGQAPAFAPSPAFAASPSPGLDIGAAAVAVAARIEPAVVEVGRATVFANPSLADPAPYRVASPPVAVDGSRTVAGFAVAAAAARPQAAPPPIDVTATGTTPSALRPADGQLARLVGKTMPLGFRLDDGERAVLDALGRRHALTAGEVAALVGVADPVAWMDDLMVKLGAHGLDLVATAVAAGEATYALRR